MALKTIALVICSTRSPRICPSIAVWLSSIISPALSQAPNTRLTILDIASYALPLSPSGSTIPAKVVLPPLGTDTESSSSSSENCYEDANVAAWSAAVRAVDAFIFLTPQYNWSLPGALKVALDHLFHEWKGKPMVVVSYGGHGGGKCAAHLRDVWAGLRGGECVGAVQLVLGGGDEMTAAQREGLLSEDRGATWVAQGKDAEVLVAWEALVAALAAGEAES